MDTYSFYRKKGESLATEWKEGFDMTGVSVSQADSDNGSPKIGDMIFKNSKNPDDKWLVASAYFNENYVRSKPFVFLSDV